MNSAASRDGLSTGRLIKPMFLLWLAGVAMRMTILAVPPVIPLIHDELHMSETQVGLLIGLPLAIFAIAAVPGSLLIANVGTRTAIVLGMINRGVAGAARGAAVDVPTLCGGNRDRLRYRHHAAGTADAGAGMAAAAHRAWHHHLYQRHADGRDVCNGADHSTGCCRWPAVSWRFDILVLWAIPAILIAPVFYFHEPVRQDRHHTAGGAILGPCWPD